jgi:hypothetical protein
MHTAGCPSVSIAQLKQRTMGFMTEFLKQQNMSTEDGEQADML